MYDIKIKLIGIYVYGTETMHGNQSNLDKGCYMSLIRVKNKVHPRNYTKKLNESSNTEKLGMHSVINKLQRLGRAFTDSRTV